MIQTAHQNIIAGEISETTPQWNLTGTAARDECFKLYIPLAGQAQIQLDNKSFDLAPPYIYLFNGTKLHGQAYQDHFQHVWIHFVPASLNLRHLLFKHFVFTAWNPSQLPQHQEFVQSLTLLSTKQEQLKADRNRRIRIPRAIFLADDAFMLKTQAFLIYLLGDAIARNNISLTRDEQSILDKVSPAIDYMETHYLDNPCLESIAKQVNMAPTYFHRFFVKHFNTSPHQFMQRKRLADARQLLTDTRQSIKEIAKTCGYQNEFYFSKVFKQEHHVTPTQFRNMVMA